MTDRLRDCQLVKDLISQYDGNVTIDIPPQYHDVMNNDIDHVQGEDVKITCVKLLYSYLPLGSYLDDSGYFAYLMNYARKMWDDFSLLIPTLYDGIRREMYLYIPFDYIPDDFILTPPFFKDWLNYNKGKAITINVKLENILITNEYEYKVIIREGKELFLQDDQLEIVRTACKLPFIGEGKSNTYWSVNIGWSTIPDQLESKCLVKSILIKMEWWVDGRNDAIRN